MSKAGSSAVRFCVWLATVVASGCGGEAPPAGLLGIRFETRALPAGDAGRPYEVALVVAAEGGAAPADRFEISDGALPPGLALESDRAGGAPTGNARLRGVPRRRGAYAFTVKAISTGALGDPRQPDVAATARFGIEVGEGTIAIVTPTAEEGTADPSVPAFPAAVPFVNPEDPGAFFSFAFEFAGGSGENRATVYAPREWELSLFDRDVDPSEGHSVRQDRDESGGPGASPGIGRFEQDVLDGGVFVLQTGRFRVQLGGFPSPRGPVLEDIDGDGSPEAPFFPFLDEAWFQDADAPRSSRRDLADTLRLAAGDPSLGTAEPLRFTDYFDPSYRSTTPPQAAKYPFARDQYVNAFFADGAPLAYRLIVEAVDTRGTDTRADDVITRKAYVARVEIPDVEISTVLLPPGRAGLSYAAHLALRGGVPPLFADLEWVDGTSDGQATGADPLTKGLLGLEIDPTSWQFVGIPRVHGPVELTVRAWSRVLNPKQANVGLLPTGREGERDGSLDPDGSEGPAQAKAGRHKTIPASFLPPMPPVIANASLVSGTDGLPYPGDRLVGSGGVPLLTPYPVGYFEGAPGAVYPSSAAQRGYEWDSAYAQDESYGPLRRTVPGLPNGLTLVRSAAVAMNGLVSGVPYDRGFHVVRFEGRDFYAGSAAAPDPEAYRVRFEKPLPLSVSPDRAVYLRGVQAAEAAGGVPTGLSDSAAQMAEPLMTPILLASGLLAAETGRPPLLFAGLPAQFDTLPVMLPNGGSDAHNRMSIPQVRGYWPAESNKEPRWDVSGNQAWKHLQQEFTWLEAPDAERSRVFLWAEATPVKTFSNAAWSQKYQQLDPAKRRGVLVTKPLTGEFFVPVVLDGSVADHGTLFGAEAVVSGSSVSDGGSRYSYGDRFYTKLYYYAVRDSAHDREAHLHGAGTYLQPYAAASDNSDGWYMQSLGRTATSVAMSSDGVWCATALPGGSNVQKILLWRTDRQPIPSKILSRTFAVALDGTYADGSPFPNSACILKVGGEGASGAVLSKHQRHLLPDSLCFVENGLLFLNETQLDKVFGVSLLDGHLSSVDLNKARAQVNGSGTGPLVTAANGQFVPDQDYVRGQGGAQGFGAQFSFAGDRPDPGEEGPDRVAFVAGSNAFLGTLSDLPGFPRQGYVMQANRDKALLFLDLDTENGGLDLSTSRLFDLTGGDPHVYGDLLTPGRPGEELDYLSLSDDGEYAAVVRDIQTSDHMPSSAFGYRATFHTAIPTQDASGDGWTATHDLMLVSTSGGDLHAGAGDQHVLLLGTQALGSSDPGDLPPYAAGRAHLNAPFRRIHGVTFGADGRTLLFDYAGHSTYNPLYFGGTAAGWAPHNPEQVAAYGGAGTESSLAFTFRTPSGGAVDFASPSNLRNNLAGLAGAGGLAAPFGSSTSSHCFWATFKSPNGNFLYLVSDQVDASLAATQGNRNLMVGFNISAGTIRGRAPYAPFLPHANTVGFEQFDCNSWNYESRFAASPKGILCVIASDASAGALSATDLEVYAMDLDQGTDLVPLTAAVTPGSANAINHLCLSLDGRVLAGQVSRTAAGSAGGRALLNGNSDLFLVRNVREAVLGVTPDVLVLSKGRSHGASLAFVGEGSEGGAQALVFSAGPPAATNVSWATRTLFAAPLERGAVAVPLDAVPSHYAVLAAGRKEDDDPTSAQ